MKHKPILIPLGLVLALLVPMSSCKKRSPQKPPDQAAAVSEQAPGPSLESENPGPFPPLELQLRINGSEAVTITQDAPLTLDLAISHRAALEASDAREALEGLKQQFEEQVRDRSLTPERAKWILLREPVPAPVTPLKLTVSAGGFSFVLGRDPESLGFPWALKAVTPASPTVAILDDKAVGEAVFVAIAETPARIPEGAFQISASFEAKSGEAGFWSGKIQSNPVAVTIKKEAATPWEKTERSMAFAEYYLKLNDSGRAEKSIREALADYPTLIRGLYLQGVLLEAKGDFQGALESYQSARAEHRRRFPASSPPWDLAPRVKRMLDKLGITTPEIID